MSNDEDNLQMLFPTVVQISQIANHDEIKQGLMAAVNKMRNSEPNSKPQSWACDLYTTIGSPQALLEYPGIEKFLNTAKEKLSKYAKSFEYDITPQPA